MKPEQLSHEWVDYAQKIADSCLSKDDEYNTAFMFGAKQVTQHYQSKVVELIEAKITEFKYKAKKAEKLETSSDLYRYAEGLQLLLTDLTNLKP